MECSAGSISVKVICGETRSRFKISDLVELRYGGLKWYVLSGTRFIDPLVRCNGSEFLFTQILEKVVDSPLVPGIVSVLTFAIIIGQGNTHEIELRAGRLLVL